MKKIIVIFILILALVYVVLSILGREGEYGAERLFYRTLKINEKITKNPDVAPPVMLASVENTLKKILDRYPDTKAAKSAHMALAEFYLVREKNDKALFVLNEIIEMGDHGAPILCKAHFLKGFVYEKEGQWDKALKEYTILRDKYTDTPLGLQVPIYIGTYYTQKGKEVEAKRAYNEAVLFYEKIEQDNRGNMLGYTASGFLRQAYLTLERYEEAGRVVENTLNNYPSDLTFVQQLPYIDLIFVKTLNKPEKAIEIYKNVIEKMKNEELIAVLQGKIEELEGKK